jgi:polyisoprenoid-binding protein YceI
MNRVGKLVVGGVVLVVLLAAGGWWLLSSRGSDSPAPAALGNAPPATTGQPGSTWTASGGTVQGTWKVQGGGGSFVGYRVREQLAFLQSPNDAVGRTTAVTGSLLVAGDKLEAASIQADLTQLRSDQSRRDNAIRQQGLQSDQFPTATFQLAEPIALPAGLACGQTVKADAKGRLTLHGTSRDVTLPLEGRWNGDTIQVAGALKIAMTDYGIQPPRIGPVVSIDDTATMEVQLVFRRA